MTNSNNSRNDSNGLMLLGLGLGTLCLGPLGAAGLAYLGHRADKWVNEKRENYSK